jgi:ferredoxin
MTGYVFEKLADSLDRLPNGFPRTESNVEIRMLQKIFTPEEAEIACELTGTFETIEEISARTHLDRGDLSDILSGMVKHGLVRMGKRDGRLSFRLEPFIVGFYENQVDVIDHELAHLVEAYFQSGGSAQLMAYQPALHRVVPARGTVKTEWILPYEDIRQIILEAKVFNLGDCVCRKEKTLVGDVCHFPLQTCLSFSQNEREAAPGDISQAEALAMLDKFEEMGLVHTVSNVAKGLFYVCNCCGCCCGILRGITEFGVEKSVAYANYFSVIDPDLCSGCGICIDRCQVKAISEENGISVVDRARCIGCGLCVSGCPSGAARLEQKADAEMIHPPADFEEWERQRLVNRGLA